MTVTKLTTRAIEIPVKSRISFTDLYPLLKQGNLQEFIVKKQERIDSWKNDRYRICLECGDTKLRVMFTGKTKRCKQCILSKKKKSKSNRRDYIKEYIRNDGLENWCAKQIVYNLKKMGIIKKSPCEVCKSENSYAHHCDYNKPWEVITMMSVTIF